MFMANVVWLHTDIELIWKIVIFQDKGKRSLTEHDGGKRTVFSWSLPVC